MAGARLIAVADAAALVDGGEALRFNVLVDGQPCSAFVVRYQGRVYGYLNRCSHVAMELDWLPGAVFDSDGRYLMCATHGALYEPDSGQCAGGPCLGRGGLRKLDVIEEGGVAYWRPEADVLPLSL
jgi:nitrite reductase/ring-hydroxylating ferredoxin subunit